MWYVYFYKDPFDDSVFYVGKGKENRYKSHLYRASTWERKGRPFPYGSSNVHLLRKILKIRNEQGVDPVVEIIQTYDSEIEAYEREKYEISIREDLCNLTLGGEGYFVSEEKRKEVGKKHSEWMNSEKGIAWRKERSQRMQGEGNHRFGKKEEPDHKKARMANLLATPKWNKGLKGDSRCKGHKKGIPSCNAKKCKITNLLTGEILTAESKLRLSKKIKESNIDISLSSLSRMSVDKNPIKGWLFEYVEE